MKKHNQLLKVSYSNAQNNTEIKTPPKKPYFRSLNSKNTSLFVHKENSNNDYKKEVINYIENEIIKWNDYSALFYLAHIIHYDLSLQKKTYNVLRKTNGYYNGDSLIVWYSKKIPSKKLFPRISKWFSKSSSKYKPSEKQCGICQFHFSCCCTYYLIPHYIYGSNYFDYFPNSLFLDRTEFLYYICGPEQRYSNGYQRDCFPLMSWK